MSDAFGAPVPVMRHTTLTKEPTRGVGREAVSIHTHTLPVDDGSRRTVLVSPTSHRDARGGDAVVVVTTGPRVAPCESAHPESSKEMTAIDRPTFIVVLTDESACRFRCVHEACQLFTQEWSVVRQSTTRACT